MVAKSRGEGALHAGHRERLRSRFLENGLDTMENHVALELLLFYSIPRADTNELAHRLIDKFGSLKGVFDAPYDALLTVEGVGEKTASLLKLVPSLTRTYLEEDASKIKYITSTQEAVNYLRPKFVGLKNEVVMLVCLSNSCRVLKCSEISSGGITFAEIDIRKIMSELLNCHATGAILAHNHPSGLCVPSRADHEVTYNISGVMSSMNVTLLNHLIICGSEYFSFLDNPKFSDCFSLSPTGHAYLKEEREKKEKGE